MLYVATGCRFTVSAGVCLKISAEVSQMDKHLEIHQIIFTPSSGTNCGEKYRDKRLTNVIHFLGECILEPAF